MIPRYLSIPLLMASDGILVFLAVALAYFARFQDFAVPARFWDGFVHLSAYYVVVFLAVFYSLRMYHRIWEYAGIKELSIILQGITVGTFIVIALAMLTEVRYPRSIPPITWALAIVLIGGSRFSWRVFREQMALTRNGGDAPGETRVLVVGAGSGGALVARELSRANIGLRVVGFVDDDPRKQNLQLLGLPVLGTREDIPGIVRRYGIRELIIAMPSAPGTTVREILHICRDTGVHTKILPGMYELVSGEVTAGQIRTVQVADLLRREPVRVDLEEIAGYLTGKTVLVTGAGGSIGSELCRQIVVLDPGTLIMLDHYESTVYDVFLDLRAGHPDARVRIEIADVRDRVRIASVFQTYRPDVVFHAAALKHVPLMEYSPSEAVRTNIFGTRNTAEAALAAGTGVFILISTDKAVNPAGVMGASKRLAEVVVQQLSDLGATRFAAVRFGNVLESSGSVVPLFKKQIAAGGPVSVTHPDVTRYFMTITEAVQLVIQAGAMARGGEIFVLDMGEPVRILDLAHDLIRLSGFEPEKDIAVQFIGIRPGEKLSEELFTTEEDLTATRHQRIYTARPVPVDAAQLERQMTRLRDRGAACSARDVFQALARVSPSSAPAPGQKPPGESTASLPAGDHIAANGMPSQAKGSPAV